MVGSIEAPKEVLIVAGLINKYQVVIEAPTGSHCSGVASRLGVLIMLA